MEAPRTGETRRPCRHDGVSYVMGHLATLGVRCGDEVEVPEERGEGRCWLELGDDGRVLGARHCPYGGVGGLVDELAALCVHEKVMSAQEIHPQYSLADVSDDEWPGDRGVGSQREAAGLCTVCGDGGTVGSQEVIGEPLWFKLGRGRHYADRGAGIY